MLNRVRMHLTCFLAVVVHLHLLNVPAEFRRVSGALIFNKNSSDQQDVSHLPLV